ncbi:MAG: hypothetical protein HOO89_01820 [Ferruginibacter sp.]|nr:hypothetical protein [Ferruginibacter sp.]
MKLFGKMLLPILVIFVTFTTFIILAKPLLLKYDVDSHVLLSANLLFLFLGILVFFIQKNALANKNPNVFIRSIIAGMMIKMFSTVLAILIYVVFTGKNYNTKAVFISLLMYLVYLAAEVIALSAENKKKNG